MTKVCKSRGVKFGFSQIDTDIVSTLSYVRVSAVDIFAFRPLHTSLINGPLLLFSLSSSLSKDRFLSRDLLNPTKKESEFRSIFQHIQTAQLCRSPPELFAQHIVSIVHYIKGNGLLSNIKSTGVWRRSAGHVKTSVTSH